MVDSIPVTCGAASFYTRKTAGFLGLKGKESCKKWQCSFFYVKNLKKGVDHINLPPFDTSGPGERDSWSASLPSPGPDMAKILQRIVALQAEGGLKPSDLLLAFLDAFMSFLQGADGSGGGAEGEWNRQNQASRYMGTGLEAL
jgi:hypothetical protein